MNLFLALFLAMAPLALADGTMETSIATKPACNTTKPECVEDIDCPQIFCIQEPCPEAICRSGKCVTVFPPAPVPVQVPTKPISPPVRPPVDDPVKAPVSPPLRAPVAPVAIPIGSGPKCGKNTCKLGDVCCNESCGICTPKDGACIKLKCVDNPTSRPTGKPRFVVQPTPIVRPPFRAPVQVPTSGVTCGPTVCKPGKVCCNESCGICTEVGEGCIKKLCVKTPSPTNKPKTVIRPRTSSPVHKPGFCKVDSDCPVPPCAKPIDDTIDFFCPIPICVQNQCIFAPRPTRKPAPTPISSLPVPIAGVTCGPTMCKPGKVCCNESCGICTEVGEGCIKKLCIKTPSPTNKPKTVIRPRTSSPVHKPGFCKVDSDCPVPACAKPIDDTIDFYCPIPICVHNQCVFAPRPTRKPTPKPISPPPGHCKFDKECPTPACLAESKECPIGKCVNNKCTLVPVPTIGSCNVDSDCPVACPFVADIDGKPVPCTTSYCVNHKCTKVKPPSPLTKCGNVMCTADENCCNASCGDCIHKFSKRACSNQICSPAVQCRFDSDCKMGKSCVSGQCILKTISHDVPCGKNTCTGGDVCCDALCGTCTKPGMFCTLGCKIEDPLQ